jgi:CDP-4-dehydro-6-deoxyglucose reductase, E3
VPGNVHHATLVESRTLAYECIDYHFRLDDEDAAVRWRAGQFISVNVGEQPDGTPILRSYSLASRPSPEARVRLVVKLLPHGPASDWFRTLRPGSRVRFTGPMGFFVLELMHHGDVVLGATGTGIAPFLPMIEELLERGEPGRIHLFWGLREESDLFWQREIAALVDRGAGRLEATVMLSRGGDSWSGARGRINPPVYQLLPSLNRPTFYLCGNGAMIRDVKAGLVERGVDRKRQIRGEAFFD